MQGCVWPEQWLRRPPGLLLLCGACQTWSPYVEHVQHSSPNPVGETGLLVVVVVDVPGVTCALQRHASEPGTSFVRCAKARLSSGLSCVNSVFTRLCWGA
jgi:hypothetical protein